MAIDWESVRAEFPALRDWTYLNTATYGQVPRRGVEAMARHMERRDELACQDFLAWFDDADAIRTNLARMIGCNGDDIAFFVNSSAAAGLLFGGIAWREGDRVVTLKDEFPNYLYSRALLERWGVEVIEVCYDRLFDELTPRTRLVTLSTVNYTSGLRPPLDEIAARCKERGTMLYLDGTQSVGALRIDLAKIQPAMFAVNGYKWMLAPNGAGFAYVHPKIRESLEPNVVGWRSHHEWRRVDRLHHGAPVFTSKAEKYEGGMLAFPPLYALGASAEMMLEIGLENIERRVMELTEILRANLRDAGGELLHDEAPSLFEAPIVAARFRGVDASALARELRERRVVVSARHGNLRVSVHFYNNEQDLDRLGVELRALIGKRVHGEPEGSS